MSKFAGANAILDDNDDTRIFAKRLLELLAEESAAHKTIMETARKTYEFDRHAEVFANKKIRELKDTGLIHEYDGQYKVTTSGRKAYEQAFETKLPEEDGITKFLLNGGEYRNNI